MIVFCFCDYVSINFDGVLIICDVASMIFDDLKIIFQHIFSFTPLCTSITRSASVVRLSTTVTLTLIVC